MADSDLYRLYHGLMLPTIAHTDESLNYLQNFQVRDDDIFAVTYPKSGKCNLFPMHSATRLNLLAQFAKQINILKLCNS